MQQLEDVAILVEADDPIGIRRFAHRARGTSGTYGLALLCEQFARLEQAAGNHPREHLARLLGTIRQPVQAQLEKLPSGIGPCGRDQNGGTRG